METVVRRTCSPSVPFEGDESRISERAAPSSTPNEQPVDIVSRPSSSSALPPSSSRRSPSLFDSVVLSSNGGAAKDDRERRRALNSGRSPKGRPGPILGRTLLRGLSIAAAAVRNGASVIAAKVQLKKERKMGRERGAAARSKFKREGMYIRARRADDDDFELFSANGESIESEEGSTSEMGFDMRPPKGGVEERRGRRSTWLQRWRERLRAGLCGRRNEDAKRRPRTIRLSGKIRVRSFFLSSLFLFCFLFDDIFFMSFFFLNY